MMRDLEQGGERTRKKATTLGLFGSQQESQAPYVRLHDEEDPEVTATCPGNHHHHDHDDDDGDRHHDFDHDLEDGQEDDGLEDEEDEEFYGPSSSHLGAPPGGILKQREKRKLLFAIILCLVFFLLELAGGIIADSLALLSDSFHLLSDLVSFVISLVAIYISTWAPTKRYTFGYHRAEVMGAFFSLLLIYALTAVLVYEAVERVQNPKPILPWVMFGVALAGVGINTILAFVLHHGHGHGHDDHAHSRGHSHGDSHSHSHSHQNMNIRAAIIHVIGDLLSSVGVLIASIFILVEELTHVKGDPTIQNRYLLADPICTFFFAILVVFTTFPLIKECIQIFMETAPSRLNADTIRQTLVKKRIPAMLYVKDVRVWHVSMGVPAAIVTVVSSPSSSSPSATAVPTAGPPTLADDHSFQSWPETPDRGLPSNGAGEHRQWEAPSTTAPVSLQRVSRTPTQSSCHLNASDACGDHSTPPSPSAAMVLSPTRTHNQLVENIQYCLWRKYRIRREFCWVMVEYAAIGEEDTKK